MFNIGSLNEIADVISGYAFKSEWFGVGNDRVIRIGDIQDNRINTNEAVTFDSKINKVSNQFRIREGDILMALSGATTGKIGVASLKDEGAYLNQRVAIIRGKSMENISYLKYILSGQYVDKLLLLAGGAAQANLSPKDLASMQIPMPPLEEQKRIAAILDKADAIRRKRQQAIDLTDQLLRSVFLELFGDPVTNPKRWKTIPLDEIADIHSGITKGRKVKKQVLTETPYMRVANVQDGYIQIDDVATIAVTKEEKERYTLLKHDILLTEGGDPDKLGRGAVWEALIDPCIHQNHIFRVRINNNQEFTPHYLSTLIGSSYGKRYFLIAAKQTTGIATINKTQLKEFPVLVPPIQLQKKFSNIVEEIEFSRQKIKDNKLIIDKLFVSLTQRAFRGELSQVA